MKKQAKIASANVKVLPDQASAERLEEQTPVIPSLAGPDKYSPANILRLQRTVGNQAVMRLLANRPRAAAHPPQIQRSGLARGVVQRKGGGIQGAMKPSAKGRLANSTWFRITSVYSDYLSSNNPEKEMKYLLKLNNLVDLWEANHGANASPGKKSLVMIIRNMTPDDKKDIFARTIGLPPAVIAQLPPATLDGLVQAGNHLEQGNLGQADIVLGGIQATIPGFDLVKSMLLRHYMTSVNPSLAGAINDKKFSNSADTAAQDASKQFGINTALSKVRTAKDMGLYYKNNVAPDWDGRKKITDQAELDKRSKEASKGMTDIPGMNKMTEQEGMSLNAYTLNSFKVVNPKLRSGLMTGQNDPNKFGGDDQHFTLTTISGMNKLKPYKGTVYRHSGLFPGYAEINHEGAIVNDMAFMSTTYLAESLSSKFGTDVVEIIKSKTGRFVKPIATIYNEDEVLFKPGTRFRVTKRYTAGLDPADPARRNWPQKMSDGAKDILKKDPFGNLVKIIVFKEEI